MNMKKMVDIAGNIADVLSIHDFIKKMLKDDNAIFLRGLKKIIRDVCLSMREDLQPYPEFANNIPIDAEDVIYDELVKCFDKDKPFQEENILPNLDVPRVVREPLSKEIMYRLNKSMEYYQRNYDSWAKQETIEISRMIHGLDNKFEEIIRQFFSYDSAKRYHEPPINRSRFHYCNEVADFIGRKEQLAKLREFCFSDNSEHDSDLYHNQGLFHTDGPITSEEQLIDFKWWVVIGEGGSGKSRLCYEFAKELTKAGWSICAQQNHEFDTAKLRLCSQSIINNTMFILDYSEYDIGAIFRWLSTFNAAQYRKHRIRVLLIQRRSTWDEIRVKIRHSMLSYGFIEKCLFCKDFLNVGRLDKDNNGNKLLICEMQKSYAKNRNAILSDPETDVLFKLLEKVDAKLLRPLFAIIIVDAYLEDMESPLSWGRSDVLDYICEREENLITHMTRELLGDEKMCLIACTVLAIATMVNGLSGYEDLEEMLPKDEWYSFSSFEREKFCENQILFVNYYADIRCPALEPDIIGEYFVIRHILKLKRFNRAKSIISTAWKRPYYMSRFTSRLLQDHRFLIKSECPELLELLGHVEIPKNLVIIEENAFSNFYNMTEVTLPNSISKIGKGAFSNCKYLRRVNIPESVCFIGEGAFSGCENLCEISIPDSVKIIDGHAFAFCKKLTNIKLPSNLTILNDYVFTECESLENIMLPETLKLLCDGVFFGCSSLSQIKIPDFVCGIGDEAFFGCKSLTQISLPDSIVNVGIWAFSACKSLKHVYIRGSVKNLPVDSFHDCSSRLCFHDV